LKELTKNLQIVSYIKVTEAGFKYFIPVLYSQGRKSIETWGRCSWKHGDGSCVSLMMHSYRKSHCKNELRSIYRGLILMYKRLIGKKFINTPVYWRFIITYLIIVVAVIAVLTPIYYKAMYISKGVYLQESNYGLMRSADDFEKTVEAVWRIPNTMDQSLYYTKVKLFRDEKFTNDYYIYLNLTRNFFAQQCYSVNLPGESFMLFTNSGAAVTRNRIFESIENCFSEQLVYDEFGVDKMIETAINMDKFKAFIPVSGISNNYTGKYDRFLTILTRQTNDSVVIGTLFSESKLLELFNIPNLPKNTFFYIKDTNNNMLISHNLEYDPNKIKGDMTEITYSGITYSILRHVMSSIGYEVIIGIPDNYFTELLVPLRVLYNNYIISAIIIGIILSIIFALFNYIPLRRLVDIPLLINRNMKKPCTNEYRYLRELMEHSDYEIQKLRSSIEDMDNTLRTNLFIRLLHGNVNADGERSLAMQLIPQLASDYRIVIIKADISEDGKNVDYLSFLVYDQLLHFLPSDFLFGQLDRAKTAVLMPDTQQNSKLFSEVIRQINSNISIHNITLAAGVSEAFTGMDKINTAFYHAQFSLFIKGGDLISYYKSVPESEPLSIDLIELQKLYELIQAGKSWEVEDMLDETAFILLNGETYSSEDVRKTFYMMRFVFESVINNMQCKSVVLPEYRENATVQELFASLGNIANKVALELEERKRNVNSELKKEFLNYINENFSSKSIYATTIADALGVSESYVYKLAKECTGFSLNDYIKKLRAEKAAQLLKTTDLSVANISDACGFDVLKTFYRTFRKYYGITPSQYRE